MFLELCSRGKVCYSAHWTKNLTGNKHYLEESEHYTLLQEDVEELVQ
jgi:hypothetical protein